MEHSPAPLSSTNCPTGHLMHFELPVPLAKVPLKHPKHVLLPRVTEKEPISHGLHKPSDGWKVPIAQGKHVWFIPGSYPGRQAKAMHNALKEIRGANKTPMADSDSKTQFEFNTLALEPNIFRPKAQTPVPNDTSRAYSTLQRPCNSLLPHMVHQPCREAHHKHWKSTTAGKGRASGWQSGHRGAR